MTCIGSGRRFDNRATGWQKRRQAEFTRKICLRCGRAFSWRKKWERDWDEVKYCSDACRRNVISKKLGSVRKG